MSNAIRLVDNPIPLQNYLFVCVVKTFTSYSWMFVTFDQPLPMSPNSQLQATTILLSIFPSSAFLDSAC